VKRRDELWVFGYGSLMWRREFAFEERVHAEIIGYHRSFCIISTHHRGTPRRPGLVLGLDRGRTCSGIAYRIAPANAEAVIQYLRARELIYGVYRETHVPARVSGSRPRDIEVLTYIAERAHPAYAGRFGFSLQQQARIIRGARGLSGTNLDYLINTVRHFAELGIRERTLERLLAVAGTYVAHMPGQTAARPGAAAMVQSWKTQPSALPAIGNWDRRRFMYRLNLGEQQVAGARELPSTTAAPRD
jgi:cation transport protein ChaC